MYVHTHASLGFSFFNLEEQQLISHSCATSPLTAPLSPMRSSRTNKRSVWIHTVTLPDIIAVFGDSAPPWFWIYWRMKWQDGRASRICRIVTAMPTGRTSLRIYVDLCWILDCILKHNLQSYKRENFNHTKITVDALYVNYVTFLVSFYSRE